MISTTLGEILGLRATKHLLTPDRQTGSLYVNPDSFVEHSINYATEIVLEGTTSYAELSKDRMMENAKKYRAAPGIILMMSTWFRIAAKALANAAGEVEVMLQVGDINYQMDERILNPALKDQRFDAVYMSNIPDYTGGHLSVLFYGLPVLKESNKNSFIQTNFLLNPGYFSKGYESTLAEYVGLPNKKAAEQLLGLSYQNNEQLKRAYGNKNGPAWGGLLFSHRWQLPSVK